MSIEYRNYGYVKGDVIEDRIGVPDSQIFDLCDTGGYLFITLKNPTPKEIASISGGGEIKLTCFPGILWLTFRFKDYGWSDCPYTPHLSKQATNLTQTLALSCSHVTIVLCNSADGKVLFSGTVTFNEELSAAMRTGVMLILAEDFDKEAHYGLCQMIQSQYSSEQIASVAVASCKYDRPSVPGKK